MTVSHALIVLGGALAMDALLGEPPARFHPVVWMGRLQRALRRWAPAQPTPAFLYGAGMAAIGPLVFGLGSAALIGALARWPLIQIVVEAYLFKSAFAVRALAAAALEVRVALLQGDLAAARLALRSLVSRDTSALPAPLLAAAAVESVAENASDSLVAPLLYYALLGSRARSRTAPPTRSMRRSATTVKPNGWARPPRASTTCSISFRPG